MAISPILQTAVEHAKNARLAAAIGREAEAMRQRAERAQQKADELHQIAALLIMEAIRLDPPDDDDCDWPVESASA